MSASVLTSMTEPRLQLFGVFLAAGLNCCCLLCCLHCFLPPLSLSLSPPHPPFLSPSSALLSSPPRSALCPLSSLTRPPPALHLLFSPRVLPVAHDPAVQPQADCGAHTAGEAALGGALARRTGASFCLLLLSSLCRLFASTHAVFHLLSPLVLHRCLFFFSLSLSACLPSTLIKLLFFHFICLFVFSLILP